MSKSVYDRCAERLSKATGLSKTEAHKCFQMSLEAMTDELIQSGNITFPGYFSLKLEYVPERVGKNNFTKEEKVFPAKNKIKFSPSQRLKALVAPK